MQESKLKRPASGTGRLARLVRGRVVLALAALVVLSLAMIGTVRTATAVERRTVCAESVWLRYEPAGQPKGVLYRDEHFDRERTNSDGSWSYGYAYGGENEHGWVLSSALC